MEIKELILITKLKEQDVAKVTVYFDGSGDDGDIQEIEYFDVSDTAIDGLSDNDENKFKDALYSLINNEIATIGDWVNNDGGYGYVYIDTEKLTHTIDYYQRTVEESSISEQPLFS